MINRYDAVKESDLPSKITELNASNYRIVSVIKEWENNKHERFHIFSVESEEVKIKNIPLPVSIL